jgi:hydroxylaminobenzene mutase
MSKLDVSRGLLRHGLIVFLLGLATGLPMISGVDVFKNPRLGLSGHLVGVTTGMFLLLLGLVVERVEMSTRAFTVAFWSALYGAYGNWVGTVFGAVCGTRAMTAIAGAGHEGLPWQEATVSVVLTTSGVTMIMACVMILMRLGKASRSTKCQWPNET